MSSENSFISYELQRGTRSHQVSISQLGGRLSRIFQQNGFPHTVSNHHLVLAVHLTLSTCYNLSENQFYHILSRYRWIKQQYCLILPFFSNIDELLFELLLLNKTKFICCVASKQSALCQPIVYKARLVSNTNTNEGFVLLF